MLGFGKKLDETEPAEQNQHSIEQIEKEIADGDASKIRSTTLTPHELYLLEKTGYEPIRVVFGIVVYSMGTRGFFRTVRGLFVRGEMVDFSRLNADARRLALVRAHKAAELVGADAVFGVHIDVRELADFLEVVCTGTAVKRVRPADTSADPVVGV